MRSQHSALLDSDGANSSEVHTEEVRPTKQHGQSHFSIAQKSQQDHPDEKFRQLFLTNEGVNFN